VADYVRGGRSHRVEVRIIKEDNGYGASSRIRKEVILDGLKQNINQVVGHFNAVLFLPQMLQIIEGSPSERRRYVDMTLSQAVPDYAAHLSAYNKAVAQRNALLKQLFERGGDPDQLNYWEEQITADGAFVIDARIHALREIENIAALVHLELTRGTERLRLNYLPAYDPLPQAAEQFAMELDVPLDRSGLVVEKIKAGFRTALIDNRINEITRGQTTIGPHRDEVRFLANGIDLGTYGSRGQMRTTMLSLKLAEIAWVKERTGHWPVLLLDEVLAELDPKRREDLLVKLSESEQAMLTTTDLDLFTPEFVQSTRIWNIIGGRIDCG
jgi:DNA replication and repair protein RecF